MILDIVAVGPVVVVIVFMKQMNVLDGVTNIILLVTLILVMVSLVVVGG
jgi:hypothetical protein